MRSSALLRWSAVSATASAECTRDFLLGATDAYLSAQSSGSSSTDMASLASPNVTYTENDIPMDMAKGILTTPIKMDFNRSIHDTASCAAFTEIIAASNAHPYVIGTRMVFDSVDDDEEEEEKKKNVKMSTMESVVTDAGDWAFNATGYLYWNARETWEPIPEAERDSAEVIRAAGDAYFDRFRDESVAVPFGVPCSRLEGGVSTATLNLTGDSCTAAGLPSTLVVTNRRYVVDAVLGVVDIFVGFPGLDRSQGQDTMPDSHMFRVEQGKIRYIHTVSSCVEAGCGMSGTGIPPAQPVRRLRHFHTTTI